jgi:hypothetical protein
VEEAGLGGKCSTLARVLSALISYVGRWWTVSS